MAVKQLAAYQPGASNPFDRHKAAHLLRRAGFGASPAEVQVTVDRGVEASVEALFEDANNEEAEFQKVFEAIRGGLVDFDEESSLQAWWAYRMVRTKVPLREKLTLFWHGHFAASQGKVDNAELMHHQIETLRRLAWGNFRDLVLAVAKDPAMLVFLDGESSTKEHPNENFARELMELFTCGVGNYTETDVLESARAFTGWRRKETEFAFESDAHDPGVKRILGKSGKFNGEDVVEILMQQPATPRFIARKLLRFFAAPEPAEDVLAEAAELLDRTQLNIKWFLRELFLSNYFYSEACYRTRISSPAEYIVGAIRALGARWPAPDLVEHFTAMGQSLYAPPNVKGWDGEQKWINSSSWAARLNFAESLSELNGDNGFSPDLNVSELIGSESPDPRKAVDRLAEILTQGDLPEEARRRLVEALETTEDGRHPEMFRENEDFRETKTRQAVATILGLPEFHAY